MPTPSKRGVPTSVNGASSTGKKRKASELDEDLNSTRNSSPKSTSRAQNKRKPQQKRQSQTGSPGVDEVLFTTQCPAKPPRKGKNGLPIVDDVFIDTQDPGVPGLGPISYAIRPGSLWTSKAMRNYKHCKLLNQTFSVGSIVYVNRMSPAPAAPPEDAPPSTLLEFDRKNLWVGEILECKAVDESHVYLRVFWLYWPEELPMGRQPYHGQKELVMSNAMDIIDAQSIASAAEVSAWNEDDDDADSGLGERYWRQTFDVSKFEKWKSGGKRGTKLPSGLSELKKHCICETEYNPDGTMFKCPNEKCARWNHEECVVDKILEDVYGRSLRGEPLKGEIRKKNENDQTVDGLAGVGGKVVVDSTPPKSPSKLSFPTEKITEIISSVKRQIFTPTPDAKEEEDEEEEEEETEFPAEKIVKRKKPDGSPRPWDGKFRCEVAAEDPEAGKGRVIAKIFDLRSSKAKKGKDSVAPEPANKWEEDVKCLRCGTVMT